jgi:cyanophycinase
VTLPGCLIPIGGAEDKHRARAVLERFVRLAGGEHARLVVIPAASSIPDSVGPAYQTLFTDLGAASVEIIEIKERADANRPARIAALETCTGLFLTGGDQVKLVSMLGGTQLADRIRQRWEAGMSVAGTSAGASALSQHMIAFGRSGSTPAQRMVQLVPGLGLAEGVIIDQHFRQRDRVGRLMTAVAYNPAVLGLGLDEDTALVIGPDRQAEVIGSGSVTVVDGSHLEHTNIHSVKAHDPIAVLGIQLHFLTRGYRYDLAKRQPNPPG